MIKHVIIWTLKESLSAVEKSVVKKNIKKNLEALIGNIDGIIELKVQIECLPTSNGDILLDSTFESKEALASYAVHPDHVMIAERDVKPYVAIRSCIDFEM